MARRSFVHRPTPREMVWFGFGSGTGATTVPSNGSVLFSTLNAAALALRPFTIVRTRAVIITESDQSAASELPFGVVATIVVKDTATAAGIASIPTPVTEADAEYFTYDPVFALFELGDATGFTGSTAREHRIDSKAARKVGIDEDIALVGENESAAFGMNIIILGRMLVKLH